MGIIPFLLGEQIVLNKKVINAAGMDCALLVYEMAELMVKTGHNYCGMSELEENTSFVSLKEFHKALRKAKRLDIVLKNNEGLTFNDETLNNILQEGLVNER